MMSYQPCVLIVDDSRAGRETLEELLVGEDYRLAFAENGPEALQKAEELTPDVILLDVMMPVMNGFDVCWKLRANPRLAEVPIIMVTALDDRDSRLHGILVGADDFVTKPFDRDELRARVRTITRLNRYRRLLAERVKFEWVVQQADDAYLIVNDDDGILYANPQARHHLGLPADESEAIAETFLAVVQRQYRCEPADAWAAWPGHADASSPRYLVRPASPTAESFWLQVEVKEMAPESSRQLLVRLRDVTASMLERRMVWTFETQVGHKIRTPLGQLTGFLEVLNDDPSGFSEEEKASILVSVFQSGVQLKNRLLAILQHLDVSDSVTPDGGRCAIGSLTAIVADISAALKLESVNLSCEGIEQPEHTFVPLSGSAVETILLQLLGNAKKFHPQQSPTVQVGISRVANGIRIQVSDDGLTLSPEQLSKMWTPYYQGERYLTGQAPGMGLGLSMVAALIWGVGGTCRAYNRDDGPGLIVELTLPLAQ